MGVLKYNSKDNQHYLVLELDKKEKVDTQLYQVLSSSGFLSCVPMQYNEGKKAFRYDLSNLISFRVRLGSTITIEEFYLLLANFYESLLYLVRTNQAHPVLLDWSADQIFLDVQGRVYFLVYPLDQKSVEGTGIYSFVSSLIKNAKPFQARDQEGISRLRSFVERAEKGEFSKEEFIFNLAREAFDFRKQHLDGYQSSQLQAILEGVSSPLEKEEAEKVVEVIGGVQLDLTSLDTEMRERTGFLEVESGSEDEEEHTTFLAEEEESSPVHYVGYLKRLSGETIELDSRSGYDTWVFGKNPKVISATAERAMKLGDNKYMSGTHFRVYYEEAESMFYVEDADSTNGTYLNNGSVNPIKLRKGSPAKITTGDSLKIGKEEVSFEVKGV